MLVDHRRSGQGPPEGSATIRRLLDDGEPGRGNRDVRIDDVLALEASAIVLRCSDTATGARAEATPNPGFIELVKVADRLISRVEIFDADDDVEALSRFDALSSASAGRHRPT